MGRRQLFFARGGGLLCGLLLLGERFANPATALEEFDDLLQAEGDDEADADGDEVDKHSESAPGEMADIVRGCGWFVRASGYFVSGSSKAVWSMVIILMSALVSPLAMPSS